MLESFIGRAGAVLIRSGGPLVSLWIGGRQTCGLTASADIWCSSMSLFWGIPDQMLNRAPGFGFTSLAMGLVHNCGLTGAGIVWCWENNFSGQLGDGTTTFRQIPVQVVGNHRFTAITAGDLHTCGRTAAGEAYCWGHAGSGQLGDGRGATSPLPVAVAGAPPVAGLAGGGTLTCGLDAGGDATCWPMEGSGRPAKLSLATPLTTLTGGDLHGCGLDAGGVAYCWGWNTGGALGNGREGASGELPPAPVAGGHRYSTIASGLGGPTCGITLAGITMCWGRNDGGLLGSPDALGASVVPVPVRVYGQE